MAADDSPRLHVEVVYAAAPHDVRVVALRLEAGALLADAVRASGLLSGLSPERVDALQAGIWGRAAALDTRLRDGDRVELTRGLQVDPKEARRQRYRRDGLPRAKPGAVKSRGSPTR
jgi:putative ubiquitin-RnfH superfamily antitoxin RatB of RatAB toxin-antitoxin module